MSMDEFLVWANTSDGKKEITESLLAAIETTKKMKMERQELEEKLKHFVINI